LKPAWRPPPCGCGEIAEATREQSAATTALARSVEVTSNMVTSTDDAIQNASGTILQLDQASGRLGELVGALQALSGPQGAGGA
jgi:methyl-accepting chemotaxis protein